MKIALIQPPAWGVYGPPAGLAQLSACLKQADYAAKLFDMNVFLYNRRSERYKNSWAIEQSGFWCSPKNVKAFFEDSKTAFEEFITGVVEYKPEMICFSVNVCSWHSTLLTAGIIKKLLPGAAIVIGGPVFLVPFDTEYYLANREIDVLVYGEAEQTLVELGSALSNMKELDKCAGIAFKRAESTVKTEPRPFIRDLDSLPFMDLSDTPFGDYDPPGHMGRHISIMTSRGCVQQCVFCGPRKYWPGFRTMSGKRIYNEIEYHFKADPGIKHIEFLDLLLNGKMDTLIEFCCLMARGNLKSRLEWHANLIVRKEMSEDVFRQMAAAGCTHVTFGIESGSQKVLAAMKKHYRIEDADAALANAHKAGIQVTCNFMFGFPGETRDDFNQTLEFLKRNRSHITIAYPSRTFCTIEPYSYMNEHVNEFDMVVNPHHGQYWASKDGKNNYIERMSRCEEFSRVAGELGVDIGLGLQTSYELDHWLNLGDYYSCMGEVHRALECFEKYLQLDPSNVVVRGKLDTIKTSGRAR